MAFQVLITDRANEDLAKLVRDISQDNPDAARKFGNALIDRLRNLRQFPFLGRVVPERGDPAVREIIHRPYRIIYRVKEPQQIVEVLRFWHGARNEPET